MRLIKTNSRISAVVIVLFAIMVVGSWMVYNHMFRGDYIQPRLGVDQPLESVVSVDKPQERYDVIVVGSDPEGVAAAISAARSGLKTLLIDQGEREILGGLMTLGWLNTVDMNYFKERYSTKILNKGIFMEWYQKIEGESFDIKTAANAFYALVKAESNIDIYLQSQSLEPIVEANTVKGMLVTYKDGQSQRILSDAVIDATQNADVAAMAGVPYSFGREDIGIENARMAVTSVFRLTGVTREVWKKIEERIKEEDAGRQLYGSNQMSAWGYNELQHYEPQNPERVRMRGLNIGRQNDDSILINALQIFGVDGTDPESKKEALAIATEEVPHIVADLKKRYPEFADVSFGGLAPELYVRETRHIYGEYRLTMEDVLENRDQWDRVAFGSYPVDIQRTTPYDYGYVVSNPKKYAIPFRSLVPLEIDGLLVVGKAASFDTLPHGSARVIPVGMATGQAAGAAAQLAQELGISFRELTRSTEGIQTLQKRLNKMGMELAPYKLDPLPVTTHKAYEALKVMVSQGIWTGGYANDFRLDEPAKTRAFVNIILNLKRVWAIDGEVYGLVPEEDTDKMLTYDQAVAVTTRLIEQRVGEDQVSKWQSSLEQGIASREQLTNGEAFMIIKQFLDVVKAGN